MSGFFGIVRTDGGEADLPLLNRIASRLKFRGPDETHVWVKDEAGFCYTFLDTGSRHQARTQPVVLDRRYFLIGEVRLDARKEFIAQLLEKDQQVEDALSDEELMTLGWTVWGEDVLTRAIGDFSFALWDAAEKSLSCARDFTGPRPFFYAFREGVFCFSNTLDVLQLVPVVSAELDDVFVRDFLVDGMCDDASRTVWRDIRRLPPGHRLKLSLRDLQVRRFLELPVEEPLKLKYTDEYLEMYRELLRQAVIDRLPSEKVSLYLSGGLDSSSVCATTAHIASARGSLEKCKAFTISWRPLFDDPEPEFAERTARYLHLSHEILQEENITPFAGPAAELTPEPTPEPFFDRLRGVYQSIATHARIVLSGDGGDDVLNGQAWPYLQYLWGKAEWATIANHFGGYFVAHGRLPPLRGGFRSKLRPWFLPKQSPSKTPPWLNEDFAKRSIRTAHESSVNPASAPRHPVHPQAYKSLHSGYWASVLESEDAGWTRVNLETRAPLLDLRILRFLLRLPPVPWCMNKQLSRKAMKNLLPEEILKRPKAPLLQDPLEACQQKTNWHPAPEKRPPELVLEFVKWEQWLETLETQRGSLSWDTLSPLSFSLWLKSIENKRRIQ